MTTKGQLRDLVAQILDGHTAAGAEVYTPSDWPTHDNQYPVILVSAPREEKTSDGGRGTVEFTVLATIRIVAKAQIAAYAADAGAELAEAAIEGLQLQIERLVINNPAITALTSQTASVRSQISVDASGEEHLAEMVMELELEFYQGPEDFYDPSSVALTEIGIHLDLENRFDPTGTYADPPFPGSVVPAPREAGPDGRDEAAQLFILPQE